MNDRGADRRFFDVWSYGYDLAIPQRLTYRPVHDAVVQALTRGEHRGRLLDIGCGTGELTVRIARTFPRIEVVGCDFSAGMLKHAAAKGDGATWIQGDACHLPFRDGSFDVVTSTEAFHWFPDQNGALRELRRVLTPGGRLLLALACPPLELLSSIAHAASRLVGEPFYQPTRAEIRRRLERAGFDVQEQSRVFRFPGLFLLPVLTTAVRSRAARSERRRGTVPRRQRVHVADRSSNSRQ